MVSPPNVESNKHTAVVFLLRLSSVRVVAPPFVAHNITWTHYRHFLEQISIKLTRYLICLIVYANKYSVMSKHCVSVYNAFKTTINIAYIGKVTQ